MEEATRVAKQRESAARVVRPVEVKVNNIPLLSSITMYLNIILATKYSYRIPLFLV